MYVFGIMLKTMSDKVLLRYEESLPFPQSPAKQPASSPFLARREWAQAAVTHQPWCFTAAEWASNTQTLHTTTLWGYHAHSTIQYRYS